MFTMCDDRVPAKVSIWETCKVAGPQLVGQSNVRWIIYRATLGLLDEVSTGANMHGQEAPKVVPSRVGRI